jgi:flagellar biosynthesis chaperone FliJ
MTLEEAKKILEKEFAVISLHKSTEPFEFDESGWIEHEKPSVLEAFRVLSKGGYYISISGHDYNMREKRLKKEYEENTKAPGSSENRIKEDSGVNPALKESASQFNDALLDEQGKKIKHLTKKIARLNKIIHKKNEELRLTKIREKNLAELGLKYVGENEKLKKKLADKIVDEIDARALKSAESALAYKEKVIAEKDEVIADLGNELAATKKELEGTNNLVRMVRNASKEYCEYGIAAEKMIQKLSKIIVSKGLVPSDVFEKCRLWANGYRFNPQLYDFIEEEEKRLEHAKKIRVSSDNAEEGADLYGVIVLRDKDYIDALKKAKDADIWQE